MRTVTLAALVLVPVLAHAQATSVLQDTRHHPHSAVVQGGPRLFYQRNDGGRLQILAQGRGGNERAVLDSADPITAVEVAPDGAHAATAIAKGSDAELTFLDVKSTKPANEKLTHVVAFAWLAPNRIAYATAPDELKVHELDSDPAKDPVLAGPGRNPTLPIKPKQPVAIATYPMSTWAVAVVGDSKTERDVYVTAAASLGPKSTWRRVLSGVRLADLDVEGDMLVYASDRVYRVYLVQPSSKPFVATEIPGTATAIGVTSASLLFLTGNTLAEVPRGQKSARPIALPKDALNVSFSTSAAEPEAIVSYTLGGIRKAFRLLDGKLTELNVAKRN